MKSNKPQSWSIAIFCYNEAGNVVRVAEKTLEVIQKMAPGNFEIIIVDDGSSDGTADKIRPFVEATPQARLVEHPQNLGIGHALRTCYRECKNENVCAIPGDGQFDVEELLPFSDMPDRLIISFYRKENQIYTSFRNILSMFNKRLNEVLLGVKLKDVNWIKIYKSADLAPLDLKLTSNLIESEICSKLLYKGFDLKEVESKYCPREYGESKGASFRIMMQAAMEIIALRKVISSFRRNNPKP